MKTYLVQIEDHDDVNSARDKVSWSKARRVLLVWPKHSQAVSRRLDLLLLLRFAQQQGTQLAVVASSATVRAAAADLGIPVFDRVEEAQQIKWRRPRRRKVAPGRRVPKDPQILRERQDALATRRSVPVLARWLVFTVGVLSVLAIAAFLLPSARVMLRPTRVPQSLVIAVRASSQTPLATASGGAPAQVLSVVVEGRDQAESTGQGAIPERAAAGTLRLTNLTDMEVEVPAGSIALTTGTPAVRYTITRAVTVPAGPGQNTEAPAAAVVPGSAGNQPAGSVLAMEGSLGLRLAVENDTPMRGGLERMGPAPTQADYTMLRKQLLDRLQQNAAEELRGKTEAGQRLLPSTLRIFRILEETQEPELGRPGDRLQLALRVEYHALAVRENDLRAVAQSALEANRLEGYRPVANTLIFDITDDRAPGGQPANLLDGEVPAAAELTLHAQQDLEVDWSETELAQRIRGRTLEDAIRVIQSNLALDAPPEVRIVPGWWPRMPFFWQRIELEGI